MTPVKKKTHMNMWFFWVGICGFMSGSDQFLLPGFLDRLYALIEREFAIDTLMLEIREVLGY